MGHPETIEHSKILQSVEEMLYVVGRPGDEAVERHGELRADLAHGVDFVLSPGFTFFRFSL